MLQLVSCTNENISSGSTEKNLSEISKKLGKLQIQDIQKKQTSKADLGDNTQQAFTGKAQKTTLIDNSCKHKEALKETVDGVTYEETISLTYIKISV